MLFPHIVNHYPVVLAESQGVGRPAHENTLREYRVNLVVVGVLNLGIAMNDIPTVEHGAQ
jgi:hypothetical protein